MPHCFHNRRLAVISVTCVLGLAACSGRVDPPSERFGKLEQKNTIHVESEAPGTVQGSHQFDMNAETVISDGCLHAWRKACAGDEKTAMAELEALNKKYPQILTIEMMMGQVLEHFGKSEEAIVHYRKAAVGNEFSSLHSFKLAQAYRKAGKNAEGIVIYRKLIKLAPDFDAAKLGLADCLATTEAGKAEAKTLVMEALKNPPTDQPTADLLKKLRTKLGLDAADKTAK